MSLKTDLVGLKQMGKEFLETLNGSTDEEAQAGFKCFSLGYLNCEFKSESDEVQAAALMKIISREYLCWQVANPTHTYY